MRAPVDLSRLDVFLAVAEAGGFTAASERLGTTKAMVSQQITRLEAEVGTSLFTRTTRRVALTESGQQLYERAAPLLRDLGTVLDEVGGSGKALTGTLRLTCSDDYVEAELGHRLAEFARLHPRLTIDLVTSDEVMDLVGEGFDVGIRTGWLRDSTMHAVRLRRLEQYVVAAPALVATAAPCREPKDLEHWPWIALTRLRAPLTWSFAQGLNQQEIRVTSRIRTNSTAASSALARSGAGATVLADFMVAEALNNGELVRLLPEWSLPEGGVYAVYPSSRHVPERVRQLLDFLARA